MSTKIEQPIQPTEFKRMMTKNKLQDNEGFKLVWFSSYDEYSNTPAELHKLLGDLDVILFYKYYGVHFQDDKEPRTIVDVLMKRGNKVINFDFGFSYYHSELVEKNQLLVDNRKRMSIYDYERAKTSPARLRSARIQLTESMLYDILACSGADYFVPSAFVDFINEFGYADTTINRILHDNCIKQRNKLRKIFTEHEAQEVLPR